MKKPTLKVMNDYCKAHEVEDVTLQLAEDCELKVTPSLSLQERLVFINRVANFCVSETGEELPEYFELIFWTTVFQMMSNMPMPKVKNEEAIDLTVMQKWIDALPVDFKNKLWVANNDYLLNLRVECEDKISAHCKYVTSFVGMAGSFTDNFKDFVTQYQQVEAANDEAIRQIKAVKQIQAVYGNDVMASPEDDIDE